MFNDSRVSANSGNSTRLRAGEVAHGSGAAGVNHLKTSTVQWQTSHDLLRGDSGLGDHGQRKLGFRLVDLTAEATARRTPFAVNDRQ